MSKDEAIGRLVRLAEKCNEKSIVRICDELEFVMEAGPYGVYDIGESVSITAGAPAPPGAIATSPSNARESALLLVASGL
jgi:hypothetical protein